MRYLCSLSLLLAIVGLTGSPISSAAPLRPPVDAFDPALEAEMQQDNVYRAYFPSLEIARKAVISFHNQLLEAKYEDGYLILELADDEVAQLRSFQFRIERATQYIEQRKAVLRMMQAERAKQDKQDQAKSSDTQKATIPTIPGYSCYETVEGTFNVAQGFTASYPNLATWFPVGSSWQKATSQGGYDLSVLKLTNSATP